MLIRTIDRAHPHSREENVVLRRLPAAAAGSSPLTLGKLIRLRHVGLIEGLIPAHAGKHPQHVAGNSPGGLIPAHAGKTPRGEAGSSSCDAHPRTRGENASTFSVNAFNAGSSPLTRGKLISVIVAICGTRLIPAHAGKTASAERRSAASRAHPRSRGENHAGSRAAHRRAGSSPLTRGKRRWQLGDPGRGRLIPAHAGKTCPSTRAPAHQAAHPRSRGENARSVRS